MRYDILIIGGGIHGAAVAQAASAAGYRCCLLEQYARPAMATSSRSSKLIHGGLRYLESGQFNLVRECLQERRILLQTAPQLVKLVPFHIPVYRHSRRSSVLIRIGLMLYTLLGGKGFNQIPRSQWGRLDGLNTDGLVAVFRYFDAQTDDAALTSAVLASAVSLGCEVHYNAKLSGAHCDAASCRLEYLQAGHHQQLEGRFLINATGPWVNQTLSMITPRVAQRPIELVQGTHLRLQGTLNQGMYYLEAPQDQRGVFAMPWKEELLVGTTETPYQGDPGKVQPLASEISYLQTAINHYFPGLADDSRMLGSFAGLRVLPGGAGSPFNRSRETLLHIDRASVPRVLTIYGGKLTAHRATAQKCLKLIRDKLPTRSPVADTRQLKLPIG